MKQVAWTYIENLRYQVYLACQQSGKVPTRFAPPFESMNRIDSPVVAGCWEAI